MLDPEAHIKVGAHVLTQLGRELVTDVEQALLECVKNAYAPDMIEFLGEGACAAQKAGRHPAAGRLR